MNQTKFNLFTWIKINRDGTVSPSNIIQLRAGLKPGQGNWKRINTSVCCDLDGIITFINTTASANITAISTADKAINWTGSLANGGYISFVIPNGVDENFSITVDTPAGRTITNSVVQQNTAGTATISAIGAITVATNTFSTSIALEGQFLSVLS